MGILPFSPFIWKKNGLPFHQEIDGLTWTEREYNENQKLVCVLCVPVNIQGQGGLQKGGLNLYPLKEQCAYF